MIRSLTGKHIFFQKYAKWSGVFWLSLYIVTFVSCQKQKHPGTIYEELTGEWRNASGYYSPHLEFTPNGKIILSFDGDRGRTIKVDEIIERSPENIDNEVWLTFGMRMKRFKYSDGISVYMKTEEPDTIMLQLEGFVESGTQPKKLVKFVRK